VIFRVYVYLPEGIIYRSLPTFVCDPPDLGSPPAGRVAMRKVAAVLTFLSCGAAIEALEDTARQDVDVTNFWGSKNGGNGYTNVMYV
jgi:hypothetical protein